MLRASDECKQADLVALLLAAVLLQTSETSGMQVTAGSRSPCRPQVISLEQLRTKQEGNTVCLPNRASVYCNCRRGPSQPAQEMVMQ